VPIFENRTFTPGLEFEITEAVVKQIELRTPYKVVSGPEAQTVLEGRIVAAGESQTIRGRSTGLPQEVMSRIVVDLAWKDPHRGEVLMEREGFAVVGHALPAGPVNEQAEVGQREAIVRLAARIADAMRDAW